MTEAPDTTRKRLDSWKEIADYLKRDVRTAMRWEQELGLPIHRVPGGQRRGVFALPDEIDAWLASRGSQLPEPENAEVQVPLAEIKSKSSRRTPFVIAAVAIILTASALLLLVIRHRSVQKPDELVFSLSGTTLRFVAAQTIPTHGAFGMFAAADLNNDGWIDLVAGGLPTHQLVVMINRGGQFALPQLYESCDSSGPTVADFDGDGNPDIAVACHDSNQVQVWWGDGKGQFGLHLSLPAGTEPIRCAAGDFNRDGIADFVADATGGGPVTVYFGHRDRTFTSSQWNAGQYASFPVVADLDEDGHQDILFSCYSSTCRGINSLRGHGDGTFETLDPLHAPAVIWFVLVADLTGDNIPDLYLGSISGEPSYMVGIGNGKFLAAKPAPRSASQEVATVVRANGHNYVLGLQGYPAQYRLLAFGPQGHVSVSNTVPARDQLRLATSADFNRDGRDDLVVQTIRGGETFLTIYLQK